MIEAAPFDLVHPRRLAEKKVQQEEKRQSVDVDADSVNWSPTKPITFTISPITLIYLCLLLSISNFIMLLRMVTT